jgi:lipopolysaccharide transport system ATP-binding protein
VVKFAEIGDALEAPVQTYSSGMAARLGFACAIQTDADVLLVDEVLAVGDVKFRMKCYRRLNELRKSGASFILVSHNPQSILTVCDSAVYLSGGRVIASGDASSILTRYEVDLFQGGQERVPGRVTLPEKEAAESTGLDIQELYFRDPEGHPLDSPVSGQPAHLCIKCRAHRRMGGVGVNLAIREAHGDTDLVLVFDSRRDGWEVELAPGVSEIELRMPFCGLRPGVYTAKINVNQESINILDGVEAFRFAVERRDDGAAHQGQFYQPRSWGLTQP